LDREKQIEIWLKQAEHDLEMAVKNYGMGGYDVCAFLCQQAVEKFLKALYLKEKQKDFPRTHFIDELGLALGLPADIMDLVYELTADYLESRYPDVTIGAPFENYNVHNTQKKLEAAQKICAFIKENLALSKETE